MNLVCVCVCVWCMWNNTTSATNASVTNVSVSATNATNATSDDPSTAALLFLLGYGGDGGDGWAIIGSVVGVLLFGICVMLALHFLRLRRMERSAATVTLMGPASWTPSAPPLMPMPPQMITTPRSSTHQMHHMPASLSTHQMPASATTRGSARSVRV